MKNREIKFRAWDTKNKKWMESVPPREYMIDSDEWDRRDCGDDWGEACLFFPNNPLADNFNERIVYQQYIGITDKNKRDIYQGDIIKFKYSVGDFAWEMMEEEEVKRNMNMLGTEYVGVITPDILCPINFDILVGNPKSTHMNFPLAYALNSTVIGNIYETPELLQ